MKNIAIGACAGVLLIGLCGCAAGSADAHHAASGGLISQLFLGIWHGIIAPITLIVEIVNKLAPNLLPWRPHFFEEGAGVAYDLGFFLAVGGGPHLVLYGRRRRRL